MAPRTRKLRKKFDSLPPVRKLQRGIGRARGRASRAVKGWQDVTPRQVGNYAARRAPGLGKERAAVRAGKRIHRRLTR